MSVLIACERCGAVNHGNMCCIACLRWVKRVSGSSFARVLIKIAERRIGVYADAGERT